jgi:signal peptidase
MGSDRPVAEPASARSEQEANVAAGATNSTAGRNDSGRDESSRAADAAHNLTPPSSGLPVNTLLLLARKATGLHVRSADVTVSLVRQAAAEGKAAEPDPVSAQVEALRQDSAQILQAAIDALSQTIEQQAAQQAREMRAAEALREAEAARAEALRQEQERRPSASPAPRASHREPNEPEELPETASGVSRAVPSTRPAGTSASRWEAEGLDQLSPELGLPAPEPAPALPDHENRTMRATIAEVAEVAEVAETPGAPPVRQATVPPAPAPVKTPPAAAPLPVTTPAQTTPRTTPGNTPAAPRDEQAGVTGSGVRRTAARAAPPADETTQGQTAVASSEGSTGGSTETVAAAQRVVTPSLAARRAAIREQLAEIERRRQALAARRTAVTAATPDTTPGASAIAERAAAAPQPAMANDPRAPDREGEPVDIPTTPAAAATPAGRSDATGEGSVSPIGADTTVAEAAPPGGVNASAAAASGPEQDGSAPGDVLRVEPEIEVPAERAEASEPAVWDEFGPRNQRRDGPAAGHPAHASSNGTVHVDLDLPPPTDMAHVGDAGDGSGRQTSRFTRMRVEGQPGAARRLLGGVGRLVVSRYLLTPLLALVLLCLAVLVTPLPEYFGWQLLPVLSGSMEPAIPVGSIVAVHPVPARALHVGDVITFADRGNPDVLVTHRVVSLEERAGQQVAVTKGDANNTTDSWNVPIDQTVGRVNFSLPYVGYLVVWLGSSTVKLLALGGVLLLLLVPPVWNRLRGASSPPAPPAPAEPTFDDLAREIDALLGINSAAGAAPEEVASSNGAATPGPSSSDTAPVGVVEPAIETGRLAETEAPGVSDAGAPRRNGTVDNHHPLAEDAREANDRQRQRDRERVQA